MHKPAVLRQSELCPKSHRVFKVCRRNPEAISCQITQRSEVGTNSYKIPK